MSNPQSNKLTEARDRANAFAKSHIRECAAEILQWKDNAVLSEGRLRELAALCAEYTGAHDALKVAESIVTDLALKIVVGELHPKT